MSRCPLGQKVGRMLENVAVVRDAGPNPAALVNGAPLTNDDWMLRLSVPGQLRDEAIGALHDLMLRAARHQVSRMPEANHLGAARWDEIVNAAADEATVSVLSRLTTFEGRSKFTTWAYKFGILYAGVEVRRARWNEHEIELVDLPEPADRPDSSPHVQAEGAELARAVAAAMHSVLTPHQRRVAVALLIDEIPIDVLAERLGSRRSALYKTLHDARRRIRAELVVQGFLTDPRAEGVK